MLKIKKLFLLFFFSILSLFFSLFSYYRPEISKSDWRNGLYGSIYPMVTLDGNLSNPLDQKLHPSLATFSTYHQSTTIIYTTYYIHHTHTTTFTYNNNPPHTITWSCRHTCRPHALSCRSHAGCHADTCTLYPYLCCMWLCINHLIPDLSYFPSMTSLFDRLCRHMT